MTRVRFTLVVWLMGAACLAESEPVEDLLAKADPAIQSQIGALCESRDDDQRIRLFRALETRADDTGEDGMVEQFAIFAAGSSEEVGEWNLLVVAVMLKLDFEPSVGIRVLAPLLDSRDERLRNFASAWFEIDVNPPEDIVDRYASYVSRRQVNGEAAPSGLTEFLFEESPKQALLVFNRATQTVTLIARIKARQAKEQIDAGEADPGEQVEEQLDFGWTPNDPVIEKNSRTIRETRLAEHVVSNAIWLKVNRYHDQFRDALPEASAQLAMLAERNEWWARRYVVEIMRRHKELRLPSVVKSLAEDSDERVRLPAQRLLD